MAYDYEFIEGFDKYGPVGLISCNGGATLLNALLTSGEWNSITAINTFIVGGLGGPPGQALRLQGTNGSGSSGISKTLAGNLARIIGGATITSDLTGAVGFVFSDSGTEQLTLTVETSGALTLREGSLLASIFVTSIQSITAGVQHVIEWDITFNHTTGGSYKVWLDGALTSLSATGVRTAYGTSNDYVSQFRPAVINNGTSFVIDHLYLHEFISGGSGDTALLNNPVVETQFPSSDSAVAWTPEAVVLGADYSTTASTNAPGANELALRQFTPAVNMTINSVGILPQATSAGANFKGVIYADNAGSPTGGALLSSGTQVTGTTSGTALTLPLVTPQALTAGTAYWIGYITDTSVVIAQVDATVTGQKAANTYGSGAPGTGPTMTTGQVSWQVWGNCTGAAHNYAAVDVNPPLGNSSYNQSATVSQADFFNFPALSTGNAIIETVAVKAYCERSDAGARTVNLQIDSSSTIGSGSNAAQSPATSYTWLSSYFDDDPATAAAWANAAALNAATAGLAVNT